MKIRKRTKKHAAFTLLEMLIVLFIIGVLIILFVPNLVKQTDTINQQGDSALTKVIETQSELYYLDTNKRPTSTADLQEGGYITKEQKEKADALAIEVK